MLLTKEGFLRRSATLRRSVKSMLWTTQLGTSNFVPSTAARFRKTFWLRMTSSALNLSNISSPSKSALTRTVLRRASRRFVSSRSKKQRQFLETFLENLKSLFFCLIVVLIRIRIRIHIRIRILFNDMSKRNKTKCYFILI